MSTLFRGVSGGCSPPKRRGAFQPLWLFLFSHFGFIQPFSKHQGFALRHPRRPVTLVFVGFAGIYFLFIRGIALAYISLVYFILLSSFSRSDLLCISMLVVLYVATRMPRTLALSRCACARVASLLCFVICSRMLISPVPSFLAFVFVSKRICLSAVRRMQNFYLNSCFMKGCEKCGRN